MKKRPGLVSPKVVYVHTPGNTPVRLRARELLKYTNASEIGGWIGNLDVCQLMIARATTNGKTTMRSTRSRRLIDITPAIRARGSLSYEVSKSLDRRLAALSLSDACGFCPVSKANARTQLREMLLVQP